MTDTDQEREDEVLRRMLKTPHKPHNETRKKLTEVTEHNRKK